LSCLVFGCSGGSPAPGIAAPPPPPDPVDSLDVDLGNGFTYQAMQNTIVRQSDGVSIENPMYASFSNNGQYLVYAAVQETGTPEVFLRDDTGNLVQLTNNEFYESLAIVNDDGMHAYLLTDHLDNTGKLYLDGLHIKTSDPTRPFAGLAISRSYLALGMRDTATDVIHIETRDLVSGITVTTSTPGVLENMIFVDDSRLAVQIFDPATRSLGVHFYNIVTDTWSQLAGVVQGDHHMHHDHDAGELVIDVVSGDPDAGMFFTALHTWKSSYLANGFAYSNNFLGRLSWTTSYVIEGLIELERITGHTVFEVLIRNSVDALLRIRNDTILPGDPTVPDFLWATRKYSLDASTPLTLFVDDAKILYPMLVAANLGLVPASSRDEIISVAESYFDRLESQYNPVERLYHIAYGVDYELDGVWGPHNWQSALGLVLIELYAATGDQRYRDRADELAARFRSEWIENPDGSIVWSYWPSEFYAGWSASDGVSVNTPSRSARVDQYYEDLSHAGLNLKFVLEHHGQFGPVTFTDSDLDGIRRSVPNFAFADSFSVFIGGDITYTPPLYVYLPLYGWSQLDSPELAQYYADFVPRKHPAIILSMGSTIQLPGNTAQLTVDSYRYGADQVATPTGSTTYSLSEIPTYFGIN
jgi:hypothetical protein